MRVMVLVKATESSAKGFVRSPETSALMEAMGRFNDELQKAGILRDGDGLKPTSEGRRVAFDGAERTVTEGRSCRPATRSPASGFGKSVIWTSPSPG
jgi:hypothetical protein